MLSFKEKSRIMTEETLDALRNKSARSTYMERLLAADEAYELYRDLPQPLYLGKGLNYMLEQVSCPVKEHDILLGRVVEYIPSAAEEEQLIEIRKRYYDMKYFMVDGGHITLDWENILKLGLNGLHAKALGELEKRKAAGDAQEKIIFLEGMVLVYRAFIRYIERYAEAAEAAGLKEAAAASRNLAVDPPGTFYEAIQLVLYVTHVYSVYAARANATLTCGRMDDLLADFYEKDLAEGRLDRETAGYIIDDFNCKSAIILGRGEHQLSSADEDAAERETGWFRNPMYDSPTYVIIGGKSNFRDHRTNPLTLLFAERMHPRFENPVYVFRRTAEDNAEVWNAVCDKMRRNSTVLIYNDETVIPAMEESGVEPFDAVNYTIHGCNWPDIQGLYATVRQVGTPMPILLMETMFDENGDPKRDFRSIEDVYAAVEEQWTEYVKGYCEEYRRQYVYGEPPLPDRLTCTDCFTAGVAEHANSYKNGAVKYSVMYCHLRNIGTAADILAALDTVVFGENPVPMTELAEALKRNFAGHALLHSRLLRAPKYGRDDDRADRHAVRLMTMMQDAVSRVTVNPETGKKDVYIWNVTITDMVHIRTGKILGATPDGRLAGVPVSENLSPTAGVSGSVTSLLNSVAKLPFERICSGALNVRMPKSVVEGEAGLARIKMLLDVYFGNGGMQLQLSVADTGELKDAQIHPENYKDLMVRITGYSAVFVDMSTNAQNEIIRRDEVG